MTSLAPIILFVYNRPNHTHQVISSLLANSLAKESNLYIYSDAPKNQESQLKVKEVRNYIHTIGGFESITIIERKENFGLAESIIDGVTHVINKYGKAIILEDDVVVSPVFLEYMNKALNHYEDKTKVWSISAWNYPLDPNPIKEDTFFWRIPHCWGWATWANRWQYYRRDIEWVENNFSKQDIYEISLQDTSSYWKHFLLNKQGKIKTWAIFWYLLAYKHNALTLMPRISYIKQIGFDDSGSNCRINDPLARNLISEHLPNSYPDIIEENPIALKSIMDFHKKHKTPLLIKIYQKIKSIFK